MQAQSLLQCFLPAISAGSQQAMGWEGYKEQHKLHIQHIHTSQTGLKNGLCVCSLLFFLNHCVHNTSQKQNTSLNSPKDKPQELTESFPWYLQINVSIQLHKLRYLIKWLNFCYFSYHRKKILPLAESFLLRSQSLPNRIFMHINLELSWRTQITTDLAARW